MKISRILAAALAATAIAAPAAAAQPADMHASTAIAAAKAQQRQDLRGEHAKDAAQHPRKTQASLVIASPGHPSESGNAKVPPVTAQATSTNDGVDWTTIALGVGGTLLALGCIVALTSRSRRLPRAGDSAGPPRPRAPATRPAPALLDPVHLGRHNPGDAGAPSQSHGDCLPGRGGVRGLRPRLALPGGPDRLHAGEHRRPGPSRADLRPLRRGRGPGAVRGAAGGPPPVLGQLAPRRAVRWTPRKPGGLGRDARLR